MPSLRWFHVLLMPAVLSQAALAEVPVSPVAESLAEVVVTARKVVEDVQEIPMSLQVLSGNYLRKTGATRLYELQFSIPGLGVNSVGMFGAGFSLRGVADQRIAGLSVAPHLNGVYLGSANLAIARLFDMERIEVLKGPQGTLYGRNSTGGSLNFITRPPQRERSSEIELAHGSFETNRAQGHLNLPLPEAAFRLAFIASEGDGYIRNSVDNRRFAEDDYWGIRGSFRVEAGDNLRLDIMAQHIRDDGASGDLWTPRPDYLVNPRDIRLTTVTLENPFLISEVDNLNVNFDYDLGFATLRSITGYARGEVRNVDDCAGLPILQNCVRSGLPIESEQWSQELQLVFSGSERIEGIAGAYYADGDSASSFYQFLPFLNSQPLSNNYSTGNEQAAALFGQATVRFAERWRATGGLRLSSEESRMTTIGSGVQDSPTLLVGTDDSDDLSWLLNLSYAVSDEVMLYASASTGYKSGGFVTTTLIDGEPDTYGPEYLTAYEAGGKSQLLSGRLRLNAAAFYYDYEDMQVSTAVFRDGQAIFTVDNAARAELYGIDAETTFVVSDRWTISGGVVWLPKREFVEYENVQTGDTLSGNDLVRAPEYSATGAVDYARSLDGLGNLSVRLEYSYRSSYFYTPENEPEFSQDSFGLLNAFFRFEAADKRWYTFAAGRNLTDEDYFNQVFLQSSPGYPSTYEIGVGIRF